MASWKTRFFTFWTGQAFSLFGSSLVDFALIWWLTEQTHSETILAVSTLVSLLPRMILGPFAGSLVDRWNRRWVMILSDSAIGLVTFALMILFKIGTVGVWTVWIVLFLRSMGSMFHQPASMASTALMVPQEYLPKVGGLNRILGGAMRVVAPVAGAFLIEVFAVQQVLLVDVVTAFVAVSTLFFVQIPQPSRSGKPASVWRETLAGIRYTYSEKPLFFVVMTCTLANVFCGPAESFKPLLITNVFGGGVLELSYLTSVAGLGMVAGGILMGIWGGFKRRLITSGIGWGSVGAAYIAAAFLPGSLFWVLLVTMFWAAASGAVGGASLEAFYQTYVPPDKQGRVFSVLSTLDNATVPLGLVLAAVIGKLVPIQLWILLVGISHLTLGIAWMGSKMIKAAEDPATADPAVADIAAAEHTACS